MLPIFSNAVRTEMKHTSCFSRVQQTSFLNTYGARESKDFCGTETETGRGEFCYFIIVTCKDGLIKCYTYIWISSK